LEAYIAIMRQRARGGERQDGRDNRYPDEGAGRETGPRFGHFDQKLK
jgi:hypothetical protein